jgi:hypothetical protein
MKNDFQSLCLAEVEVHKVKFLKTTDTGIDFSNRIDAWAKMEFSFSQKIHRLRDHGVTSRGNFKKHELNPLVYSFRQKID